MIKQKDILADMHTHTIFSQHALSTIRENIEVARSKGLKFLVSTDHYFNDGTDIEKKNEMVRMRNTGKYCNVYNDITIIGSTEFNLGQELYDERVVMSLKWRPIGLHTWFLPIPDMTCDEIFNEFVKAANKGFNAFVHIERELYLAKDYNEENAKRTLEKLVDFAVEKDIWLEVNESSLLFKGLNYEKFMRHWIQYAKDKNAKIYLGTDSHFCERVGTFTKTINLLNEIKYPKDRILNLNEDMLKDVLT